MTKAKLFTTKGFSIRENNFMLEVLNDEKSWGIPFKFAKNNDRVDIDIQLTKRSDIAKIFSDFPHLHGLSVCDSRSYPIKIYICEENWKSIPETSGYTLLRSYITYLILHEFGHALGHGHEQCSKIGDPAPVMMQQTLGTGKCYPDPWVLKN